MGTLQMQLNQYTTADNAATILQFFNVFLPLGSVIYVWLIGWILDEKGLTKAWWVEWAIGLLLAILQLLSCYVVELQYVAIVLYPMYRTMLFATNAHYLKRM